MTTMNQQLDFEDFTSDTQKLSSLLKKCEISTQKHKLSNEYYRSRKFLLLIPAITSCVFIGILGFVLTTDAIKPHMNINSNIQISDLLTLLIGFCGFIVGLLLIIMNTVDYSGRELMHEVAIYELSSLCDKVRGWKIDRNIGTNMDNNDTKLGDDSNDVSVTHGIPINPQNSPTSKNNKERKAIGMVEEPDTHKIALVVASGKALQKVENEIVSKTVLAKKTEDKRSDVSRFSGFNGAYHQINRSCKSTIPTKLSRPFDLFESRLECMSLGHLGIVWDTRMRRNQIMRLAAIEIYNEITGYWLWPFGIPDIDHVIDKSMKRVARLISKDYRAPIKVYCCGFTIFRCCCRKKTTSKFNVLNHIMDGMDEREKDLMDERGVTDYIDRGEYKQGHRHYDDDEDYYDDRGGGGRGGRSRTKRRGGGASRTGFSQGGTGLLEDDAYSADQKLKQLEGGSYYDDDGYTEEGGYSRGEYDSRGGYSREYSRGYSQEEYASQPQDSRGYSRDGQSVAYTEDRGSYGRGSRAGDASRQGGYSVESQGEQQPAWDEASESQYAY